MLASSGAQSDPPILRQRLIGRFHLTLKFDRTLNCVDGAGEFYEDPVAHQSNDSASVLTDERVENIFRRDLIASRVAASFCPMRRLYPTTSAMRMAANRRSTALTSSGLGKIVYAEWGWRARQWTVSATKRSSKLAPHVSQ
jgi:hypothetical protein